MVTAAGPVPRADSTEQAPEGNDDRRSTPEQNSTLATDDAVANNVASTPWSVVEMLRSKVPSRKAGACEACGGIRAPVAGDTAICDTTTPTVVEMTTTAAATAPSRISSSRRWRFKLALGASVRHGLTGLDMPESLIVLRSSDADTLPMGLT